MFLAILMIFSVITGSVGVTAMNSSAVDHNTESIYTQDGLQETAFCLKTVQSDAEHTFAVANNCESAQYHSITENRSAQVQYPPKKKTRRRT